MALPQLNLMTPANVGSGEISAAAMQAPARASQAVAGALSNVAKSAEGIALQIGKARDAGQESQGRQLLRDFEGRMAKMVVEDPNQERWMPEYEKGIGQLQAELDRLDLSPNGRAEFERQVSDWQGRQQNNLMLTAARASVERDKQAVTNEVKQALDRNDRDAGVEAIKRGTGTVFTPEQGDAMLHEFEKDIDSREIMMMADGDPTGAIARMESEDFHEMNPRVSPEKKRQLLSYAKNQLLDARGEQLDLMEVEYNKGNLTPADVEAAEFLSDKDRQIWNKRLTDYNERILMATPAYQEEVVGRVSSMIADYNPEMEGFDEYFVEMDAEVRKLPPGPVKDEMNRKLNAARSGKLRDFENAADVARSNFTEAYKSQFYGQTKKRQSLRSALDDGLLEDQAKLLRYGFDEDQAAKIAGAKKESERLDLFRTLHKDRPNKSNISAYEREVFRAIRDGKGATTDVEWEDPQAARQAEQALGRDLTAFERWLKANPEKVNDEEAITKKVYEIVSPRGMSNFMDTIIPPMVLPDNSDFPDVPNFLDE